MRITTIEAIPKQFRLREPFTFADTSLAALDYALVRIQTDEGISGYGECPIYWNPSGETQASTLAAISKVTPYIVGKSPFQLEGIMDACDTEIYGAFAAKCGIDMALYDIQGKKLRIPVHDLLGGANYPVKVNGIMPLGTAAAVGQRMERLRTQGNEYLKVKVDDDIAYTIQALETATALKEPSQRIFIDVNQGWRDADAALDAIAKCERFDLAWIEQPLPAQDIAGLKRVSANTSIPIVADESLYSYQDAYRLAKEGTVRMFNIKLAKSGGIYLGKKIKAIADAAGIPCVLGSMIESSLGMLANYHFARTHRFECCGLSANGFIEKDYDFGLRITDGELIAPSGYAGLGYPDEAVLAREFER